MTTIIAPNGDSVGTTFQTPDEYATEARRRGWIATVLGSYVYLRPGKMLSDHIEEAKRSVGL
jgi:hypothetical protein